MRTERCWGPLRFRQHGSDVDILCESAKNTADNGHPGAEEEAKGG